MIRGAADALDAILIELEMRGHRVQLSSDYYGHRPPVDVAQRPIKDHYYRRPNEWAPKRPTIAYVRNAEIGLTLFELTETVRVRRTGVDRYVRISELPPTRRYAPQAPGETDETRDMPTGRFVLRAYSPRHDAPWQHEWTESQKSDFITMGSAIADALEEAVPVIVKQVEDAEQRRREQAAREQIERRRRQARERAEARQRARQAGKEELQSIVKAWNDAFALDAFFNELSRCAQALVGEDAAESCQGVALRVAVVNREKSTPSYAELCGPSFIQRALIWTRVDQGIGGDAHADRSRDSAWSHNHERFSADWKSATGLLSADASSRAESLEYRATLGWRTRRAQAERHRGPATGSESRC